MIPCHYPARVCAAFVLISVLVAAQSATPIVPPFETPSDDRVEVFHGAIEGGAFYSAGANWKARFSTDGIDYAPRFGGSTERPILSMNLVRARTADASFVVTSTAEPRREGDRVRFLRGDVVEVYDLGVDRVEQSFWIDAPIGSGDLELVVALRTNLSLTTTASAHAFTNEQGTVSMTRPVLIDAEGRRFELDSVVVEGELRIVAAASMLAQCSYPIVIDPVIQNTGSTAASRSDPAVAFVHGPNVFIQVSVNEFSPTDHDIYYKTFSRDGALLTNMAAFDLSFDDWTAPAVAGCASTGTAFVVAVVGPPAGINVIKGRPIVLNGLQIGATVDVSQSISIHGRPDVGGQSDLNVNNGFLVVWEYQFNPTDRDIYARFVQPDGNLGAGVAFSVATFVNDERNPAVSASGTRASLHGNRRVVTWDREVGGERDVYAQYFDDHGLPAGAAFPVNTSSLDTSRPRPSTPYYLGTTTPRFMMVFESSNGGATDVGFATMQGDSIVDTSNLTAVTGLATSDARTEPCVETDGCGYAIFYRQSSGLLSSSVLATTLHAAANGATQVAVEPQVVLASAGGVSHRNIDAAVSYGSGTAAVRFFSTWEEAGLLIGSVPTVRGVLFEKHGGTGGTVRVPLATDGLMIEHFGVETLGQIVSYVLTNTQSAAYITFGAPMPPQSICGLPIGVDFNQSYVTLAGPVMTGQIPCTPAAIGFTFAIQGGDLAGTGCFGWRVSDALWVTIQ